MTARTPKTLAAAALTAITALAALTAVDSPAPATAGPPSNRATGTAIVATTATRATTPHTRLSLHVTGCNRCRLRLAQALEGRRQVWQSRGRVVRHGWVAWTVPTRRTRGLSITVLAPWDGGAGYVPTVAFRYAREHVGDPVTDAAARTKRRASACWAGTPAPRATIAVTVVHARSTNPPGDPIRTPRAFTSVTQDWLRPMLRAWHGITGTQDATYCG